MSVAGGPVAMRKVLIGAAAVLVLFLALLMYLFPGSVRSMTGRGSASGGATSGEAAVLVVPGKEVSQSSLRSLWVTTLAYDAQGNLWVGTEDDGLYFLSADRSICRHVTTAQGLGDTSVYAVAVDAAGRVWAGHRASGVSVLEGGAWKNYNMLSGPLGHRVFDIAANPRTGDVWIATDCGVTQYVAASASWQQHTTMNGMPSNAAYRVAIADDDTVVVGLQAEGLAVAQAANGYKQWRHIDGPARAPLAGKGIGLPTCQINDLAIGGDGLWVATPFGLAHAKLSDLAFTFWRGADWKEKARLLRTNPLADPEPGTPAMLSEDHVSRIEMMADGRLAIGYRLQGVETVSAEQLLNPDVEDELPAAASGQYVAALALSPDGQLAVGAYGRGVTLPTKSDAARAVVAFKSMPAVRAAARPSAEEIEALLQVQPPVEGKPSVAAFIGDDWATQGDTVNHYGRQLMVLPWTNSGSTPGYRVTPRVTDPDGLSGYSATVDQKDRRHLFRVTDGNRSYYEWNDGSWMEQKFPSCSDGPDLWFDVSVPSGVHRVSLLFINQDAHDGVNANRDFFIELKPYRSKIEDAEALPPLCRARAAGFYQPVLKQFALSAGRYLFKVNRQHSHVGKCAAVFIDRLNGIAPKREITSAPFMEKYKDYRPQAINSDASDASPAGRLAVAWNASASDCATSAIATSLMERRIRLYRAAGAGGVSEGVLSAMRWELPYVTEEDHKQFDAAIAKGRAVPSVER